LKTVTHIASENFFRRHDMAVIVKENKRYINFEGYCDVRLL
jgi:hypothetical protein